MSKNYSHETFWKEMTGKMRENLFLQLSDAKSVSLLLSKFLIYSKACEKNRMGENNAEKKMYRVSKEQKKKMVSYMAENVSFARGQFSGQASNIDNKLRWEELCSQLNSLDGCYKSVEQWKKCWIDIKTATKKQHNLKRSFMNKTGGGSSVDAPRELNNFEEEVLKIITIHAVDGDSTTPESGVPATMPSNTNMNVQQPLKEKKEQDEGPSLPKKIRTDTSKCYYNSAIEEAKSMQETLIKKMETIEKQVGEIMAQNQEITIKLNILLELDKFKHE